MKNKGLAWFTQGIVLATIIVGGVLDIVGNTAGLNYLHESGSIILVVGVVANMMMVSWASELDRDEDNHLLSFLSLITALVGFILSIIALIIALV